MSGDYLQYIVSNAVCVLVFGIMLVHDLVSIDRQEKQIKFDRALIPFMAYFIFDALWAAIQGGLIPKNIVSQSIIDFALAICLALITYMWLRFALAAERAPNRDKPLFHFITTLPVLVTAVGLIIFYIVAPNLIYDENLNPQITYLIFMNAASYFYLVAILVYTIRLSVKEKDRAERHKHLITGLMPLMVVIGGIVQPFFPSTAIFCFACTFLMLIFFIQSMQGQISLDPLTSLNNRGQLAKYFSMEGVLRKEHKSSYVIMIDVNDFKGVNDTYGHAEGDRALVILADSLRKVCGDTKTPTFVARYGGDEFIIVAHPESEDEIHALVASIREQVEARCASDGTPYVLSLGIGYDELGSIDNFQACMQRADQKLYLDKEKEKKKHIPPHYGQNDHKPRA